MNKFGAWAKTNWLILVLSAVALVALPTMMYFSSKMSAILRAKYQKTASADYAEVSKPDIHYTVPDVRDPDKKSFEKDAPANAITIDQFRLRREAIKLEAGLVGKEALQFNKDDHKPLIEGMFPEPTASDKFVKPSEFAQAFIITGHADLLKKINAGGPADPIALSSQISDYLEQQKGRLASQHPDNQVSDQEQAKLARELLEQRIGRIRQHASEIAVYADKLAFLDVPTTIPDQLGPLTKFWDWQVRFWEHEDLCKAVAKANAGSSTGVPGGVVKRVLRVNDDSPSYTSDIADDAAADASYTPAAAKDPVQPDYAVSLTGRTSGQQTTNQFYDHRILTVDLIVSSARLPQFFDALAQTNFMTVLRCDIEKIEPMDDLKDGYFYGDENVVKATLQIETLWLRAWTRALMPRTVKIVLGVIDDAPAPAPEGEQPPPK